MREDDDDQRVATELLPPAEIPPVKAIAEPIANTVTLVDPVAAELAFTRLLETTESVEKMVVNVPNRTDADLDEGEVTTRARPLPWTD